MAQPPQDEVSPTGGRSGHPDPEPGPEPEPPAPIPPPDPVPTPEPPHALPVSAAPVQAAPVASAAAGADPAGDAPTALLERVESSVTFPPLGAYPGEPGHPDDSATTQLPAVPAAAEQPTASQPVVTGAPAGAPAGPLAGPPVGSIAAARSADEQPTQFHPMYPGEPWEAGEHGPWHPAPPPGSGQPWPLAEHPPYEVPLVPAEKPRRTALWVSLALTFTLLLCGGGAVSAFLLLRNSENGKGSPDPGTAVTRFLTAAYTEQNAAEANELVCREARDAKKVTAKVNEIRGYANQYDGPHFRWDDPTVANQSATTATVSVALTMTTDDEKTAQQHLTFTVVKKTGWWVCEIAG